jgi:hypothetical protein
MFDTFTGTCLRVFEGHQGIVVSIHAKNLPGFYNEFRKSRSIPNSELAKWGDPRLDTLVFTFDSRPKTLVVRIFGDGIKGCTLLAKCEMALVRDSRLGDVAQRRFDLQLAEGIGQAPGCLQCLSSSGRPAECQLTADACWQRSESSTATTTFSLFLRQALHLPVPASAVGVHVTLSVRDHETARLVSGSGDRFVSFTSGRPAFAPWYQNLLNRFRRLASP